MPSQVSDQQLGDAILESVEHGSFPQSEDVVSAPVPSTSIPKLLEIVGKAKEDTKNEIRKASRESASDVDGWIAQARKLQDDIKRSQETAKEIVKQAESGKDNSARLQDAATKVSLLHSEIAYNESLVQVVEQLQDISTLLDSAQNAAVGGHVIHALDRLEDADSAFQSLGPFEATRVVGVLKTREDQLKAAIIENVTESWNGLVLIDTSERSIALREEIEREAAVHINTVVDALTKLDLMDDFVLRFTRDFDKIVISSRLTIGSDKVVSGLIIEGDVIRASGNTNDMSVKAAIEDIHVIAEYLSTRLPPTVAVPLSAKLIPIITARLVSNWLLPAVPLSVSGIQDFQEMLSYVMGLVEYLDELGWSGQHRLVEWVDRAAEIWLARQKESTIAGVQKLLPKRVKEKKTVERVETQVIAKGDAMLAGQEQHSKEENDDDWGADWGDGDDEEHANEREQPKPQEVEEEDMSAWGMDDEDEPADDLKDNTEMEKKEHTDEDDGEDWGAEWGDEDDTKAADRKLKSSDKARTNGTAALDKQPSEQEVTLRETYTVTAIPDALIEIILQVVADVETLNSPELVQSTIAPASGGLYTIPSLLLAMYRATAALHYAKDIAGNMLIYNDCQRLSDLLRTFLREQTEKDKMSNLPGPLQASQRLKTKFEADIKTIDVFGKRAYGREMESQRQIIRDHLDDAQGFQGCTNVPFASVCDDAIMTTIDRVGDVKRQWQNVLSHSALLQSLGSLVSTALTKFINDVEDMPDIAAEESKKLHGYVNSLSSLSSLFQTEDESGELRDMTSIYTPNWFKFQYLGEILDSSLADIKYMWTDGELKLEMEAEEVVDLIKALFAESDYRRKAIADIRRTSMQ